MAYCLQSDVEQRAGGRAALVQLADTGNGEVDATIVTAAIRDADAWIDSYAQERYAVPFGLATAPGTVPPVIARLSAEEAVYRLRCDRRAADEYDHTKHEQAAEWLTALSKGSVSVGVEPGPNESEQIVPENIIRDASSNDADETVSRDALRGFV